MLLSYLESKKNSCVFFRFRIHYENDHYDPAQKKKMKFNGSCADGVANGEVTREGVADRTRQRRRGYECGGQRGARGGEQNQFSTTAGRKGVEPWG